MALHNIEIRTEWGGDRRPDLSARVIRDLSGEIIDLQNSIAEIQSDAVRTNLTRGQTIANEWRVAWTNEELSQAVHAPMHKNRTHNALIGMQPLADRFRNTLPEARARTGPSIRRKSSPSGNRSGNHRLRPGHRRCSTTRMAPARGENTPTAEDLYVQDAL